jgi:hypothetical protein
MEMREFWLDGGRDCGSIMKLSCLGLTSEASGLRYEFPVGLMIEGALGGGSLGGVVLMSCS